MIEYRAQSAGAWEALCTEQFQLCSIDWAAPSFGAGLRVTAENPYLSLHQLRAGAFAVSRGLAQTRRHDSDDLMVVFHDRGEEGRVEHRGTRSLLGPGDAVVIDTRLTYRFDFGAPVRQTVLKIPRTRAARLDLGAGRVMRPQDSPLGRVLRLAIREMAEAASAAPGKGGEGASLAAAAIDLLGALVAADPPRGSGMLGHEALLQAAKEFVRSRFWDPDLNPVLIGEHLHVSPRLVAKIFSNAGMTPAAYIRTVRMEEAARLFRSPAHRNAAVFDIGLRVGFPDATSFTRAFKRAHGVVPSEFRARYAPHPKKIYEGYSKTLD